jgi:hypothetical protein
MRGPGESPKEAAAGKAMASGEGEKFVNPDGI